LPGHAGSVTRPRNTVVKKDVGIWIDHKQAIIVVNLNPTKPIKRVLSNL
jgi:hypothetical protein